MIAYSTPARRPVPQLAAALLAVTLPIATLPLPALAAADVTPASASGVRKTVQDRAKPMLSSDPGGAAELLRTEAKKTGDPILFIDAGEAFLAEGVAERDKTALQQAIEQASIGMDIAAFQQDPRCDPAWQHLDAGEYDREMARGKKVVEDSEKAIADLDKPAPAPRRRKSRSRRRAPRATVAASSPAARCSRWSASAAWR
ncbi:hypothetical protein OV079_47680 [Nannocystis pusilla]|uniref:Uncharacterized protein n=1 Tax=Nannocystis pusilla TaxID=889268 RepID=A0A9X3F1X3_9BACT|nr:hypothetical protein [Nannocystis pusilla]MCY1013089.1 hypothetical protein [Nannocystis pusilla]